MIGEHADDALRQEPARLAAAEAWALRWLTGVAHGRFHMSQRTLASIIAEGGGLDAVTEQARLLDVHLASFLDESGQQFVVATRHPIQVLC